MNEIMRRNAVRIPKIIKVDITTDLALSFSEILKADAKKRRYTSSIHEQSIQQHLSHKFWIPWYQLRCWVGAPDQDTFVCLTSAGHEFCVRFVKRKLQDNPTNSNLHSLLEVLISGKEVQSC